MSPWLLLSTACGLLVVSRLLVPRPNPPAEVHGALRLLWWLNRFYCGAWHRLNLPGLAPLPPRGPALLIANHTCGIDNFLLQAGCDRVLGFLVTHEWYDHWLCHPFCRLIGAIAVRRDGREVKAVREALRTLERGRVVPIFLEGRINPDSGRSFREPMPGAAFLALSANVPVIPAYISGTPPTNNIWKSLATPSEARVVFGPPIDLSAYQGERAGKDTIAEVSQVLMAAIRALKDDDRPAELEADPAPERPPAHATSGLLT